jgi:hypothetical protein
MLSEFVLTLLFIIFIIIVSPYLLIKAIRMRKDEVLKSRLNNRLESNFYKSESEDENL